MRNKYTDFSDEDWHKTESRNMPSRTVSLTKLTKPELDRLLAELAIVPKTLYDIPSWNETGEI